MNLPKSIGNLGLTKLASPNIVILRKMSSQNSSILYKKEKIKTTIIENIYILGDNLKLLPLN
jgi:hypothetical protein